VAPGVALKRSSSLPSNGWTGLITDAFSSQSAISRPPKPRRATMTKSLLRPWPPDSDEIASDKPGLVQSTQDDDQRQIEFGIWSP